MLDPAVLEAKFQGAHISGQNQLAGFHAQIGGDAFDHLISLAHFYPSGGAEGQVVGAERGAGEAKSQLGWSGELAEGETPGRSLWFIRIQAQVVHFIGNCQPFPQGYAG